MLCPAQIEQPFSGEHRHVPSVASYLFGERVEEIDLSQDAFGVQNPGLPSQYLLRQFVQDAAFFGVFVLDGDRVFVTVQIGRASCRERV